MNLRRNRRRSREDVIVSAEETPVETTEETTTTEESVNFEEPETNVEETTDIKEPEISTKEESKENTPAINVDIDENVKADILYVNNLIKEFCGYTFNNRCKIAKSILKISGLCLISVDLNGDFNKIHIKYIIRPDKYEMNKEFTDLESIIEEIDKIVDEI